MYSVKKEICTSIREGTLCPFMVKDVGCSFMDNHCRPIVPECKNAEKLCDHITIFNSKEYCEIYMFPEIIWKHTKKCPLETHVPKEQEKTLVVFDPRKAAKQRRRSG